MEISILQIKRKADMFTRNYFRKIYLIFLFVNMINVFIQLIPSGIISIALSFFTVTLTHAYTVVSMKMIHSEADQISFKDSFAGYYSFMKVFPAYLMKKITLTCISVIIVLPAFLLINNKLQLSLSDFINWMRLFIVGGFESSLNWIFEEFALNSILLVTSATISAIVTTVFSYGFALVPYLLESYDIAWNEALLKSWQLMKGHKRELLLLQFLYLPRMIISTLFTNLLLSLAYVSPLFVTVPIFFYIYAPIILWLPQMQVATALFFEVLKTNDENTNTNQLFRI